MANFDDIAKKLKNIIPKITDRQTMGEIASSGAKNIVTRTRIGKGVSETGGRTSNLTKLSDGYKRTRKALKKQGILSPKTSPAKSNLTKTGELLDSVKSEGAKNEARIYIEGSENVKKVEDQIKQGREFMNLSKADIQEIREIIEREIKRHIG